MQFMLKITASALICSMLHACAGTPPPRPAPVGSTPRADALKGSVTKHSDSSSEATVIVFALVGVDGRVRDVRVDSSSGNAVIDAAALRDIRRGTGLTPGTQDGVPVEMWGRYSVTYKRDGAAAPQ